MPLVTPHLPAYLARIEHPPVVAADAPTLASLTAAHVRRIPFENLDPLCGVPVADLSADALAGKLVSAGRGGFCYEQNGLIGHALRALGFGVERLAARVVWMRPPEAGTAPQTHELLAVSVAGGERFLVDVGFGDPTPPQPLRDVLGIEQETTHETYRLVPDVTSSASRFVRLEARIRDRWQPLYVIDPEPRSAIDRRVACWYVSTHPESAFVTTLKAAAVTDDGRLTLAGRRLAEHRGGETTRVVLPDASSVIEVLASRFGIALGGIDPDLLESRIAAVLDA